MSKFQVNQRVIFQNTSDSDLDGNVGLVVGFVDHEYPIVLFDCAPQGYNPAIMISENCLSLN